MSQFEIPVEDYGRRCREVAVRSHEVWAQWVGVDPAEELKWWLLHEMAWAAALAASTPLSVEAVGHRVISAAVQAQTRQSGVLQSQSDAEHDRLRGVQNRLLRGLVWDVAGNPFRPVAFDPAWRTGTAVAIARGMYEAHDFSAMPILADALMDAGCDDEDVLAHCREPGPHVRGCWVVDGVLGKL